MKNLRNKVYDSVAVLRNLQGEHLILHLSLEEQYQLRDTAFEGP